MARPTKRTVELVGKLEYAFALGCTVTEACLYAGISRDTYYEWCKTDPKLSDRMDELKESPILIARETVIKGIKKDPDLALKFLERRKKDEFSTKTENDITSGGKELAPVLVQFITEKQNVQPEDNPDTN